jgi:hypothetical protein
MKTFFISMLLALSVCGGLAQVPFANDNSTNDLSISLWTPDKSDLKAPATVNLQAYVRLNEPGLKAGDCVKVEFMANAQPLASAKAIWHDVIRPQVKPGQATPMWVMAAGFYPAKWDWTNVPAGTYILKAWAVWTNGVTALSDPVTVTVLP